MRAWTSLRSLTRCWQRCAGDCGIVAAGPVSEDGVEVKLGALICPEDLIGRIRRGGLAKATC